MLGEERTVLQPAALAGTETNMPPTVDKQALDLTHAIALQESGSGGKPNYTAVGDNGTSHGAYQWQPGNYESAAKEAGLDPNDFSSKNQDKVAYYQVKKYKDEGLDPGQIASIWNSGSPDNWKDHSGTTTINGKPIHYDTPAYVNGVKNYYKQLAGLNGIPNGQPVSDSSEGGLPQASEAPTALLSPEQDLASMTPQTPPDNLGTDLSKRLQEGTQAASEGISAAAQGNVHGAASGLLQTVGAGAGAIGDTVNRGLELIPGVKQVESLLGKGVGALAQTPTGQAVASSIRDSSAKHPELSKDIGAGFNIATALPILSGLGAVKAVAGDAISQGLKGVAEKSAQEGFGAVVNSTKAGAKALARNPDTIKTLIDERAIPDIEGGKYVTQDASAKLDEAISHIEDNELQPELAKASTPAISTRFPFSDILKSAEAEATASQESFGPIKRELQLVQKKYGDYLTLQQINDAKRVVARKISQAAFGSPDSSAMKVARSVLQQSVEDGAKTLGLSDVAAINQKMGRLIKAQNILKYIDRKSVKTGMLGGLLKDVATGAGEMAGNATGIPLAGAYVGRETGGLIGKKIAGARLGILNRTGADAARTPLKKAGKKVIAGVLSAQAQKATKSP